MIRVILTDVTNNTTSQQALIDAILGNEVAVDSTIFTENLITWADRTEVISRSEKYHGVIITESLELQFIEAAFNYIKKLDDQYDIAADCAIQIQSYDNIKGWQDDFIGKLDFTTLKYDTKDVKKLTISAFDNDFANKLLERSDIEIPYDRLVTLDNNNITPFTNEYVSVNIDGIEVKSIGDGTGTDIEFESNVQGTSIILDVVFEGNNPNVKTVAPRSLPGSGTEDRTIIDSFFVPAYDSVMVFDFSLEYTYTGSGTNYVYLDIWNYDADGNFLQTGGLAERIAFKQVESSGTYTFEYSGTKSILDTQCLLLWSSVSAGAFQYSVETLSTSELNIQIFNKADATPCKFVPPYELGTRIIESITGQSNGLDSPYFGRTDSPTTYDTDGEGALLFNTNGKLIRQFPTGYKTTDSEKKAQLASSFEDWFNAFDMLKPLGAGVKYEDDQYKLLVDDRKEFYKNEVVVSVSRSEMEVDTFEKEKNLTLYYNEIEIGSSYEQPEEVSGLEEYNSKQKYSSPILNENKLELINKWIYAAYPFEFARRLPFDKEETTDYKYDGNNFIFNVERYMSGYVQLSDTDFEDITGLENITTYINLNITPKRNLLNYGWWLNGGLRGYQDKELSYNKSDIVTDLSTRKTGESDAVVENDNVIISTLESPLLTGRIVRFQAPVMPDVFKTLQSNPYGLIEYYDVLEDTTGYGYIKEVSTNLIDKKTNWELWETTGYSEDGNFILLQDGSYFLTEEGGRFKLED